MSNSDAKIFFVLLLIKFLQQSFDKLSVIVLGVFHDKIQQTFSDLVVYAENMKHVTYDGANIHDLVF